MFGDLKSIRFIMLGIMSAVSLMILIVIPNVISILFGWDGLRLVSYLLVIYYHIVRSYSACLLTVLSNRIYVFALLVIIALIINFGIYFLSKSTSEFFLATISIRKLKLCYVRPSYFSCLRSARPRVICDFN